MNLNKFTIPELFENFEAMEIYSILISEDKKTN